MTDKTQDIMRGRAVSRHHLVTGSLLIVLSIVIMSGCGGESQSASEQTTIGGLPGNQAPDFALSTVTGDTLRLSDLRGDVVLVDFWATWCGPCKMAMPHLQEIHEEYQDKGVQIVAISVDKQGAKIVKPFIAKHGYSFQVLLTDNQIERKFGGIQGIPTTFIIGPDGKVFKRFVGYQPKGIYLQAIKALKPDLTS
jgi:thiol-disulfide isomerase/thioredoxin